MSMWKLVWVAFLSVAASTAAAQAADKGKPAGAQRPAPGLSELDCRTLLRLDGDERAYTLVYLHGFVSGRRNQMALSTDALAEATDRIVDHCIDKPGDKLLQVFEQLRPR